MGGMLFQCKSNLCTVKYIHIALLRKAFIFVMISNLFCYVKAVEHQNLQEALQVFGLEFASLVPGAVPGSP